MTIPCERRKKPPVIEVYAATLFNSFYNYFTLILQNDPNKRSQVVLQDCSKYGTSVNGVKIRGTFNLKSGDELLFGKNNSYYM